VGSISVGAASTKYDVSLNSPYIPWNTATPLPNPVGVTLATFQPAGYTGLISSTGPYLTYRVLGSAIRVELLTSNAGDNIVFTVVPRPAGGTTYSNAVTAAQARYAVSRLSGFGNGGRSVIQSAISIASVYGTDPEAVLIEDNYAATAAAYPTDYVEWSIWWATTDGAVTAGAVGYRVSVVYDVLFQDPAYSSTKLDDVSNLSLKVAEPDDDIVAVLATSSSSRTSLASSSSSSAVSQKDTLRSDRRKQ